MLTVFITFTISLKWKSMIPPETIETTAPAPSASFGSKTKTQRDM
jgi:hypothetical protein